MPKRVLQFVETSEVPFWCNQELFWDRLRPLLASEQYWTVTREHFWPFWRSYESDQQIYLSSGFRIHLGLGTDPLWKRRPIVFMGYIVGEKWSVERNVSWYLTECLEWQRKVDRNYMSKNRASLMLWMDHNGEKIHIFKAKWHHRAVLAALLPWPAPKDIIFSCQKKGVEEYGSNLNSYKFNAFSTEASSFLWCRELA